MIIRIAIIVLLFSSCSTTKRTMITSAVIGSVVGGLGGSIFSPDKNSINKNAFLFGTLGAVAGAGSVYLFKQKPIDQVKMKQMLLDEQNSQKEPLPLFDFDPELQKLNPKVEFKPVKKYQVPLEELPPELKGKVKKQFIVEYESPAKTMKIGNRTIQVSPFKAWEHIYEE